MKFTKREVPGTTATGPSVPEAAEAGALYGMDPQESSAPGNLPGEPGIWSLPHRPESAGVARRVTRALLEEWGVDDDCADLVLLVVSELVTNAVEHALPPIALLIGQSAEGAVRIEVEDGGPAPEEGAWATTGSPGEHGRGRHLVAALATAHGSHPLPGGATHWASLPLTS
ncbi:ATP-binding protein [Streptomyces sp. NPDC006984]|uniref:ATP-binding protein n=1 Tax=Streptomyces sp. NPDC006984 TaxID=3155463 RepID=UPI0033F4B3F7